MSKRNQGPDDSQGSIFSVSKRRKLEHEDTQRPISSASKRKLRAEDYTMGWICALSLEMAAATAMLDDIHADLPAHPTDHNTYTLGRIGAHNIVIACLPSGVYGTTSAAIVAVKLLSSFQSVRFGLMVGIGGGVPTRKADIRLGDIVVSKPTDSFGGIVQYNYGKTVAEDQIERTGTLNKPPQALLTAVSKLQANRMIEASRIPTFLSEMVDKYPEMMASFSHRGQQRDQLFQAEYDHIESGNKCNGCDANELVTRPTRATDDPEIFYGLIASGNQVMKHGGTRDRLAQKDGILCFEMEAAGLMDNFPCLVIRGICDYADSHKNKQWQKYAAATAAAYAKELLSVIPENQVAKPPTATTISNTEHIGKIVQWLTPTNFSAQQIDIIAKRQDGTGLWLLKSEEYLMWIKGQKQTLFCPGIPGAGKMIMSSIVVDHLQNIFGDNDRIGIACLFCSYKSQNEQTWTDLLASLLKQLTQEQPVLPNAVEDLYEAHIKKNTRPSFHGLSAVLSSVVNSYSRVFFVVDALDECRNVDGAQEYLLHELFKIQNQTRLSLLATSRFIPEIEKKFEGSLLLEIRARDEDVLRYLDGHMSRLSLSVRRNPDLQEKIKTEIVKAASGMFLLVQLHLDSLVDKITRKALKLALEKLAKGLDALDCAYDEAMERIEGQKARFKELAKRVLSWITCAKKRLTISELRHALAVEIGESKLDEENLPEVEDMISVCAGLVTVDEESNIIRLVHYTTQKYFERTWTSWFPNAQEDIAKTCVSYLSFDNFEGGFCQTDEEFEARLEFNPFYNYASRNWGYHFNPTSTNTQHLIPEFLTHEAKVASSSQAMMISNKYHHHDYSQNVPKQVTGVHLAAYFGLRETTIALLEHGHQPDIKNSEGRTPLAYAVINRHEAVVRLLVARVDVDVNSKDTFYGRTPLSCAATSGHEAMVRLLLARIDVKAHSKDNNGRTPLSKAAANGHEAAVRLLMARADVDVDSKDTFYGRTSLSWAATGGHEAVVRLLVARANVDVDSKDTFYGRTPLSWAAENGHEAVVGLLMMRADVDVNSKDANARTPLSRVVERGHRVVVRLLLARTDVDVNSKDSDGRTPLSYAAMTGHEAVVRLLLARTDVVGDLKDRNGQTPLLKAATYGYEAVVRLLMARADVEADSKDNSGQTPLARAAKREKETVVKLLLKRANVDVNSKDLNGRASLSWAAERGQEAVTKLLLARADIDVNSKDVNGQTPLSYAATNGHEVLVGLLLVRADIDVNSKDINGQTPLSKAAERGREAVISLLLAQADVDVNLKNSNGRTPLSWAATNGHATIVKLLLAWAGVDVDLKDVNGQTPLSYAAANGHKAVIRLLLTRADIDVNSKDINGQTPLSRAAERGQKVVTRLLLAQAVVDVNLKDINGRTPLSWAVANRHETVIKLLLTRADAEGMVKD